MKKKFAFFLMGKEFNQKKDQAVFETERMISYIYTVNSLEEAVNLAKNCAAEGVGAIELCGAFGENGARQITEATGGTVAIGYVINHPGQDSLFAAFFQ